MKTFLTKTTFFISVSLATLYLIFYMCDGSSDFEYLRFTTPKQTSLITGTSRSAWGIRPEVLNSILNRSDIFNYSFNISASPYGPVYLHSISLKLDTAGKNGIFIVTADPWSLSSYCQDVNDTSQFRERSLCLGKLEKVDKNPNIRFFTSCYTRPYYNLFKKSQAFLHDDGWFEVTFPIDPFTMAERLKNKITFYDKEIKIHYRFSDIRFQYLVKIIAFLKKYGRVYLVRLPIHPAIMDIENEVTPWFNDTMKYVSKTYGIPFFNMTLINDQFVYFDGNHLEKQSSLVVSGLIAEWILGRDPFGQFVFSKKDHLLKCKQSASVSLSAK